METFYEKLSQEFFKEEWSDYEGKWGFRHLLRYLSDRRVETWVDKGSLWIDAGDDRIEILLYWEMDDEEQKDVCEKLYNVFHKWKGDQEETMNNIRNLLK